MKRFQKITMLALLCAICILNTIYTNTVPNANLYSFEEDNPRIDELF